MSNKRIKRSIPIWSTCFCIDIHRCGLFKQTNRKLAYFIQKGNLPAIEHILKRIKQPLNNLTIIVKRHQFNTFYPYLMNHHHHHNHHYFYQECSPVLWAIDCLQWNVLPLLSYYGIDINRPQLCRRWTDCICKKNSRSNNNNNNNNILPYRKFWTHGHYTYQSALDYFFASIYEYINDNYLNDINLLTFYNIHLTNLLTKGIDIHRINSVIIFNLLAISFNQYLYQSITSINNHLILTKINNQSFIELLIIKKLIKNGYSQFECMDYLYSYCNWFSILLCILCHPNIDLYRNNNNNNNNNGDNISNNSNSNDNNNGNNSSNGNNNKMPKLIKQSILLLINLLVLKCTIPTIEEFSEFIENLPLCKLYIKYYYYHNNNNNNNNNNNKYNEFYKRLIQLHQLCYQLMNKPFSLKLITRNKIRKQIGGIDFHRKINNIDLPKQLITFIQYINYEQFVIMNDIPKQFIQFIQSEWIDMNSTIDCNDNHNNSNNNNNNTLEESMNIFNQSSDLEQINNNNDNNRDNEQQLPMNNNSLQRGRASERQHIHMYQRRINKHKPPLRPTSAPLLRTFVR
ncbi:hypothetical protein MS3_00002598 [Schistosoma haematobium]|uniref:SOCS box domain-containing protein n=1 Tax=Schistosoma haematobium TaxID=6185 RepID=A0A922S1E3_SCHHA|nr:hypothetical protein MS3_00002598 [Schistosoma haematobium]KAH9589582.1 hypothetical protein MS3_00002598 [Schistosoma haematobium]